jgi:tripeptide aminopeptidase
VAELQMPESPKTTYNVGIISGGSSVNTIAAEARATVDVRSERADVLAAYVAEIKQRFVHSVGDGLEVSFTVLGERPAGQGDVGHPLVQDTLAALAEYGFGGVAPEASSTDANVAISLGIPCVCIGTYTGDRAHSRDEWADISNLHNGIGAAAEAVRRAAHL